MQLRLDRDIALFKRNTGLKCAAGCSACCNYESIEATVLEFLPFAYHSYRLGLMDQHFDELEGAVSGVCAFHQQRKDGWGCSIYPVRGLICRLFGFSATLDKNSHPILAACKELKGSDPATIAIVSDFIASGGRIPVFCSYYSTLAGIDPALGSRMLPINLALKNALETVYFHFPYRENLRSQRSSKNLVA